jgi:hypothetical protein
MVSSTNTGTGGAGRPTPGATPTFPTDVTATSVTVTSTSGCQQVTGGQGGFPGGQGGFPGGGSFTPPAGGFGEGGTSRPVPTSSAFPGGSGSFRGRFGGGGVGGAFGTITAIGGSSFTVKSSFGSGTTITVKTTASTMYDATSTGSATDVKKGLCVNAIGSDDVSGVLDAQSVSISSPVNGACPVPRQFGGFVRSGGFPGGPGGA